MSATDEEQTNSSQNKPDEGGHPEATTQVQDQKGTTAMEEVAQVVSSNPEVVAEQENKNTIENGEANQAMIAEAAAAAIASVAETTKINSTVQNAVIDAATAAALAVVKQEDNSKAEDREAQNEERRKRYREKMEYDASSVRSGGTSKATKTTEEHSQELAARRQKDRERYANMTAEQRQIYNTKRREQYHRQSEKSRQKRRERERSRYHSLSVDAAKERNARRAQLERERYQRLTAAELEEKNRKRRERAAAARARSRKNSSKASVSDGSVVSTADSTVGSNEKMDEVKVSKVAEVPVQAAEVAVAQEAINEAMKEVAQVSQV